MEKITTIGLDLAKQVFQVHGVDEAEGVVVRATAHYWALELTALGHEVCLMPPQYVKAYVKCHKNDAVDAEATCEAVRSDQDCRAAGDVDVAPRTGVAGPPAHHEGQRVAPAPGGTGGVCTAGAEQGRGADRDRPGRGKGSQYG
jgi:hypothetical protein